MASDGALRVLWKGVKGFLSFWKNFLIGDSPVLALGVIIIVGVAYLLHDSAILATVSTIVSVLVLMAFSVWQRAKI